jgi:hypothetical protein
LNNSNRFEFDFELNLTAPRNCSRGPVVCALASPISRDSVPPPARAGSEPVPAASHRPLPLLPHCTNKRRCHRRRAPFRSIPCSRPSSSETEPPLTTLASYPLRSSASSPPHQESRPPPLLLPSLSELRHAPLHPSLLDPTSPLPRSLFGALGHHHRRRSHPHNPSQSTCRWGEDLVAPPCLATSPWCPSRGGDDLVDREGVGEPRGPSHLARPRRGVHVWRRAGCHGPTGPLCHWTRPKAGSRATVRPSTMHTGF